MTESRMSYRGHPIVLGGSTGQPRITIDGEDIHVVEIAGGVYASGALPHASFSSLDDLARALIDHSPVYHGRRDIKDT